ncbi:MAG: hypothetical protein ACRD35_00150 [Candidatus Acidiferrales bacterium]
MLAVSPQLRALLQEFVDARLDVPDLLLRAEPLLPPGTDPGAGILEILADADLRLALPAGRQAFVRRLEQFAEGETSYTELGLWCFGLGQTEALSPEKPLTSNLETALLREVMDWIEQWDDEAVRPRPEEVRELAQILAREKDPKRCLESLEEALARFGRL